MFPTHGARRIASITELRSNTSDLIDAANETGEPILIQRNNRLVGVLLGEEQYEALREGMRVVTGDDPRLPGPVLPEDHPPRRASERRASEREGARDEDAANEGDGPKRDNDKRMSFTLEKRTRERVRDMAYWERVTLNEIGEVALSWFLARVEAAMGRPYPNREDELRPGPPGHGRLPWSFRGTVYKRLRDQIKAQPVEQSGESTRPGSGGTGSSEG